MEFVLVEPLNVPQGCCRKELFNMVLKSFLYVWVDSMSIDVDAEVGNVTLPYKTHDLGSLAGRATVRACITLASLHSARMV